MLRTLDHGNYRLMSLRSGRVFECTHVRFDESTFPGVGPGESSPHVEDDLFESAGQTSDAEVDSESSESDGSALPIQDPGVEEQGESSDSDSEQSSDSYSSAADESTISATGTVDQDVTATTRRYPLLQRTPTPSLWRSSAYMVSAATSPQEYDTSCHAISSMQSDSPTLKQALSSPDSDKWQAAIAEELQSLHDASTWELVDAPKGARVFPSKFVLKVKRHSDGTLERYKARLVLLGHLQRPNIDFYDTYAPVADFTVVQVLLALACHHGWLIRQFDVKTAFLNGDLDEVIYMQLPEGFRNQEGQVCRLLRSIYGLRQAPRAWNKKLCGDLQLAGFRPLVHAESVFRSTAPTSLVVIVIYVDDILVISHDLQAVEQVKSLLSSLYTIKDLGDAEYFLGVKIERLSHEIKLTQTAYIASMLERFNMVDCKPAPTPMVQPVDLMMKVSDDVSEQAEMKGVPFREAIGSLLYLSVRTRPDIAVAVSILSRHSSAPRRSHWEAVKRVMRYLKASSTKGLVFRKTESAQLSIYCDSDWATDPNDRHSRTGVLCFVGDGAVSWTSRKQPVPSVSSCEAEYIALFEAGVMRCGSEIYCVNCRSVLVQYRRPSSTTTKAQSLGQKEACVESSMWSSGITTHNI